MQPVSPQPPLQARATSVQHDLIAGVTLAAYAIPVSLAYATLAGLPPQVGLYGYMAGGLGYALAGSSRYLAVGPTSAISLMIGGTVGSIAGDNPGATYQIVVNTAVVAGLICLLAWLFRLSVLVKLISDSVLTGFKAGAGLTIALTQMPALLGVPGGGHGTPERILLLLQQLNQTNVPTLAFGLAVLALLIAGDRFLPGKPISLAVVALSIAVASMLGVSRFGVAVTGVIPSGLPSFVWPDLRLHNYEGIVPLAAGCVLLAYIEGVAAARAFALKHGQEINPRREFLGLGAANLATGLIGGYPVAGGLSQTAVNESAGARSRLSLMFASVTLAFCLLFLTGLLADLPKAVLAAVVLLAVRGLIDARAILHMATVSRVDLLHACTAFAGVLVLGILQGILLAALVSVLQLLFRYSAPHIAYLGRIPGTQQFSDLLHHPQNEPLPGVLAFRPEASLLYLNADYVLSSVMTRLAAFPPGTVQCVVCDLSASPRMDLAGTRMLGDLQHRLAEQGVRLVLANALSPVRDLLRAEGLEGSIGGIADHISLLDAVAHR